jgi:hypothetical protein
LLTSKEKTNKLRTCKNEVAANENGTKDKDNGQKQTKQVNDAPKEKDDESKSALLSDEDNIDYFQKTKEKLGQKEPANPSSTEDEFSLHKPLFIQQVEKQAKDKKQTEKFTEQHVEQEVVELLDSDSEEEDKAKKDNHSEIKTAKKRKASDTAS